MIRCFSACSIAILSFAIPIQAQPVPAPSMRFTVRPETLDLANCQAQLGAVPLGIPLGPGYPIKL